MVTWISADTGETAVDIAEGVTETTMVTMTTVVRTAEVREVRTEARGFADAAASRPEDIKAFEEGLQDITLEDRVADPGSGEDRRLSTPTGAQWVALPDPAVDHRLLLT